MIAGARFRADRMAAAVSGGFLAATDLADHLVTLGWPFRRAHEAVGRLVRACLDRGVGLEGAGPAEFAHAGLEGLDLPPLTAEASVEAKRAPGGTARAAVLEQMALARARVAAW
jgi:argininosuccinate lyase